MHIFSRAVSQAQLISSIYKLKIDIYS